MKKEKSGKTPKRGVKRITGLALSLCIIATSVLLVLSLGVFRAYTIEEPADYGLVLDADHTVDGYFTEENGLVREGAVGSKIYSITGAQGFVTLARVSRSADFAGYTFRIAARDTFLLQITVQNKKAVSDTSFFGIGCAAYPFRGSFLMVGSTADSTYLKMETYAVLFNVLSNEASIRSENEALSLCVHSDGQFALCDTLVITKAGTPLDVGGFRFAAEAEGGVSAAKTAGFVAGTVKSATGTGAVSVDLSRAFPSGDAYVLSASAGNAGGLFGVIEESASVSVTLGSFAAKVSAADGDAGILVGTNRGGFTVERTAETDTLGGQAAAGGTAGAAGLFGRNAGRISVPGTMTLGAPVISGTYAGGALGKGTAGSVLSFGSAVTLTAPSVTGNLAGGLVGESDGTVTVADGKTCTITDGSFTATGENPMLGGAVGRAGAAPSGAFALSGGSFSDAGCVGSIAGGFIGSFTADAAVSFENVSVASATLAGELTGGYFGLLELNAPVSLRLSDGTFTHRPTAAGTAGGVIGRLTGSFAANGVTLDGIAGASGTAAGAVLTNTFENGGFSGILGGLVGLCGGNTALRAANLTVRNTMALLGSQIGDLVGVGADGAVMDIEAVTYRNATASVAVSATGAGTILRLSGTITDNSPRRNHFVAVQENSLLFTDAGFTLGGSAVQAGNDVGNYGQLIRNEVLGCLSFDGAAHTVGFSGGTLGAAPVLSSAADAAKLAVTLLTEGVISGVSGINSGNFNNLLSAVITLTGDIDLRGSGIEQFGRADGETAFSGTLNGGGFTLTLAIGENVKGESVGVLTTGNARRYLGAFPVLSGATVTNLNLAGDFAFLANAGDDVFLGGLAGCTVGNVTVRDCTTAVTVRLSGGSFTANNVGLYAGGLFGQMRTADFSITGSTLAAELLHTGGFSSFYSYVRLGGAAGAVSGATRAVFEGNTVSTVITQTPYFSDARVGGCFAEFSADSYTELSMTGTKAENVRISVNAGTGNGHSAGGLIGREFRLVRIVLDSPFSGTVTNAGKGTLGGLIYRLTGKLTLESGFSLSGTLSSGGTKNGCLLADGTGAIVTVRCAASAFDGVTATGFDLFAGRNVSGFATNGIATAGGVVTVETAGAAIGEIPADSAWFEKIAAFNGSNADTRYYFNVAGLENHAASSTVSSAADLLYWSLYDYASASLSAAVLAYSYPNPVSDITGANADIDVSGLCFYPAKKENVTFKFGGRLLTFGRNLTSVPSQMRGLQCGIFSDIITTDKGKTDVIFGNIRIAGTVYKTPTGGSGVFVSGRLSGSSGTAVSRATVTVSDVFFEGVRVSDTSGYCPLLLCEIGSYVSCEIENISQYTAATYLTANKTSLYAAGEKAGSSLIGKGGIDSTTSYLSVTLKTVVFESLTTTGNRTIFTRATLFDSIRYAENTGSSFVYTFTATDDWGADGAAFLHNATYGKELYTNAEQYEYYDAAIFVSPESPAATALYEKFGTDYLVYVYETATGESLSVNRKITGFDGGWGTYGNPYLISGPDQLLFLARLVASDSTVVFPGGWKILYPAKNADGTLDYTQSVLYEGDGANSYLTQSGGTAQLTAGELLAYLRGAYYRISVVELELPDTFTGIGIATNPFHGVIAGCGGAVRTVIRIPAKTGVDKTGFGFINVANGCAVYGIEFSYAGISFTTESSDYVFLRYESNRLKTSTSGPSATSAEVKTLVPHFGGVIGWILGGDNRIENVSVSVAGLTCGRAASVFGGYVGLISGGGVTLESLGDFAMPGGLSAYENYYYYNPYVGKVIVGYAFSTDADRSYDNTDKNYPVPHLIFDRYGTGSSITVSGNNLYFSPATAEELLMLSFAMNGGAMMYNSSYIGYGNGALSRRGDYSAVGGTLPAGEAGGTAGRHTDDESAGGKSLFHTYFGISASDIRDFRTCEWSITLAAGVYDLGVYGNAFRGFGSPFGGTNCYNIKTITGASDAQGNPATEIVMNVNIRQYYNANMIEADGFKNLALVLERKSDGKGITFSNIVLSGTMSLTYYHVKEFTPADKKFSDDGILFCVGGFLGYAKNLSFVNVGLRNLTVVSPGWAAGLVASAAYANQNCTVTGCAVSGLTVRGTQSVGALFSFLRLSADIKTPISGVTVTDSVIELCTSTVENRENDYYNQSAGGLIGLVMNNRALAFANCSVTRTAVLFSSAGTYSGSANAFSGGLIGKNQAILTITDCTVDGCVIFSGTAWEKGKSPFSYSGENPTVSGTVYDAIAALAAYSIQNTGFTANGSAGGLIGRTTGAVTVNGCAVTSDAATGLIFGFNNAAGAVAESTAALTVQGLRLAATDKVLYLIGRSGAAGVTAWNGNAAVAFSVKDTKIGGGASLLYLLGTGNNGVPVAGGFFGDLPKAALTLEGAVLSGCVISANRAAGVAATKSNGGAVTLTNLDVFGNLIQGSGNSAAGLLNAADGTVSADGLYFGDNVLRLAGKATGLGYLADTVNGTLRGYFVLMRNNDAGYSSAAVRADTLMTAEGLAALCAEANASGVGHIAYRNAGTVEIFALSISATGEHLPPEKQFISGTGTVLYAAYGAAEKYFEAYGTEAPLTKEGAFRAMGADVTVSGKTEPDFASGDPLTKTGGVFTPDYLYALDWWGGWADAVKSDSGAPDFRNLGSYASLCGGGFSFAVNGELPVFTVNGDANAALAALLNLITGGGFAAMTGVFDVASVTAVRYNIENDGALTLQEGSAGSILYENGTFRADVYDVLSADKQTVTLLTVTFGADYDGSNYGKTYSVTVLVYYPQILTVKTNIAAIEGEIYRLGAFLDSPAFKIDISMGSSFSFLVEYAYSDAVENIDGFNFGKRIHSVLGDGKGNGRAFPAGTTVVLIDLNSVSPAGFRYYTGVTEEDPKDENGACYLRFTGLTDVSGGGFSPRLLEAIRANGVYEEGHLYENESGGFTAAAVERYLMVVIPVEENCSTYQYNLKAEVEENDRNIVVEATENLCRISVWNEEGGSVSMDTGDTVFSNGEGGTLTATVTTEKPFSDGYYTAMKNRSVFGTHLFRMLDADRNTVSLPAGTLVTLTDGTGKVLYSVRLTAAASSVPFGVGNIMEKTNPDTRLYSEEIRITLDFSGISAREFNAVFSGATGQYYLRDDFYLSGDRNHYTGGVKLECEKPCYAELAAPAKVALIPTDRKYLGINLADPTDLTNNGKIAFRLAADFSAIPEVTVENATVSFSLLKKVYNGDTGKYEYLEAEMGDFAAVTDAAGLLTDGTGTFALTDGRLDGEFLLTLNHERAELTNYRLAVTVTGIGSDGVTYTATDYFVFLYCNIPGLTE